MLLHGNARLTTYDGLNAMRILRMRWAATAHRERKTSSYPLVNLGGTMAGLMTEEQIREELAAALARQEQMDARMAAHRDEVEILADEVANLTMAMRGSEAVLSDQIDRTREAIADATTG
jgi:hypothetical protein